MKFKIGIIRKKRNEALEKRDRICRRVIEYGILGLIIFSPMMAASVYEWSILVIQLTVLVMMAAYFMIENKPRNNGLLSRSLKWPRFLFLGFYAFLFLQVIPFPSFMAKMFSPNTYSFQKFFSVDFSKIEFMSFSILPSHTAREGLELISYFLFGFLIVKTVTRMRQIKRIFYTLVILGVFEALYGFFELYNKNPKILFFKKIYNLDSVTGTFVNRNHFSGYLEMIIPLTIGLIIARIDLFSLAGLKWREKILRLSERGFVKNLLLSSGIILMALAIIFSKSRSGVFLLVFSFILFFGLTFLYYGGTRHQQKWVKGFLKITFMLIIFVSLYMGINATIERFALDKLPYEGRPVYWTNATAIVADFPIFGAGLGTFSSLYPAYEKVWRPVRLSHAHNDYLEFLAELGIVGFILLFGGIIFILIHSFLVWKARRYPEVKGLVLGGIVAVISLLIHSITDFNLHIPANMLLFSVVLSLLFVTVFYRRGDYNLQKTKKNLEKNNEKTPNTEQKKGIKGFLVILLVVMGVADILIYWNQHLYNKARQIQDSEKRLKILKKANRFYPFNDLTFYEQGKAYFDCSVENLKEDSKLNRFYLRNSIQNFSRSLSINPVSQFGHFYLARALHWMSYFPSSSDADFYQEYKKATILAGHNSQIHFEVGKIFLTRWNTLGEEDRVFVSELLKKAIRNKETDRILSLLNEWKMNVKDYDFIKDILPEDAGIYRMYAKFLGEKQLSSDERHEILAREEFLDFSRAKEEYHLGRNASLYLNRREALGHFKTSLDILENVKFYQMIIDQKSIDFSEFCTLKKSLMLNLAKDLIEMGEEFRVFEPYLMAYLELEDDVAAISELETYLLDMRLIDKNLEANFDDLDRLCFKFHLYFKQNRYREVAKAGSQLKKSFVVVPESKKEKYVEILQLIGDSFQNLDFIYDSADFYNKALEIDPDNLHMLLRIRQYHERMNEDSEIRKTNNRISRLLSPRVIKIQNSPIDKGSKFSQRLTFDGSKINLWLYFKPFDGERFPLISVFFNGQIVWEDYLSENVLSIPLETKAGENRLEIVPVNRAVDLFKLSYDQKRK